MITISLREVVAAIQDDLSTDDLPIDGRVIREVRVEELLLSMDTERKTFNPTLWHRTRGRGERRPLS